VLGQDSPTPPIRIVTAGSLFDGHDAAINVMRRLLQRSGAEVIHLGHNRSAAAIVECAIAEDANGIAVTSYQGGHLEYLRYMHDLLAARSVAIPIFAGGGGTILPHEIEALHAYGIARVYSPDDGRAMGLQGMIDDLLARCARPRLDSLGPSDVDHLTAADTKTLARLITLAENDPAQYATLRPGVRGRISAPAPPVLGITGTGGAGKSSIVDELLRRLLHDLPTHHFAVISIDPSQRKTGGALLGDRIRMNSAEDPRVFVRSMATRAAHISISRPVQHAVDIVKAAGFDLVIVETTGIGQSDSEITDVCDLSLYVMTSEYGAASQLEKIDMLDFADLVAINKFDKQGALDALREVRKQVRRNRGAFKVPDDDLDVFGTVASAFADAGTDALYTALRRRLIASPTLRGLPQPSATRPAPRVATDRPGIIPPERERYLAEIAEANDLADETLAREADLASRLYRLAGALTELGIFPAGTCLPPPPEGDTSDLVATYRELWLELGPAARAELEGWPDLVQRYRANTMRFFVRGNAIEQPLFTSTLSGLQVPKICVPNYRDWGDVLRWLGRENVPGNFPYTAGVFPLKRTEEDPTRMFAGEGGPERTNRRFHFVAAGMPAKRLSTAFDSVTLYGEDPDARPDIYGKIGNSGVSVAHVDDAKRLYSGFWLGDPRTSVSMTINGPAPMVLAFFLHAAIDQACERWIVSQGQRETIDAQLEASFRARGLPRPRYRDELPPGHDGLGLLLLGTCGDAVLEPETYARIRRDTLVAVRGTVQADILKEDQAQNTCIFSTEFALRMMGDIQAYFIDHGVRNFYSVSISGYHIAEAGANPITQLAFTLANGFTYVEYYLSRGMNIDDFAPNLSFFFSNGLDPEYTVIGRVARRIWARAMRNRYGANPRSAQLKYHIQTSGRSLHAQEIAFNDVRTTLQALTAIYDHCNSLHTNAYDEAITTPTQESVRRAIAIQLIINKEHGLARNENPNSGSFIIEELCDLVENAVMQEFRRISARGGVLGAMERMYQRTKIQEESLLYESLKHEGALPIVGVNTFLDPNGSPTIVPGEVIRSTDEEKQAAIAGRNAFAELHRERTGTALEQLQAEALAGHNTFAALMEASKACTLGQLSGALYVVGGQYRRSM